MYLSGNLIKRLVVLSLCLCCVSAIWADEPKFRVDSYIPERFSDFQWRIDGILEMAGNREEFRTYEYEYDTTFIHSRTQDTQRFELKSDMNYLYESSNRFLICSLKASYGITNSNPPNSNSLNSGSKPGIYLNIDGGEYLFLDCFIAISGTTGWLYSHNLHDVNPDTHHRRYSVDGALMVGWGRSYEGRYAATALNIIDELRKDGIIIQSASYDEMHQLTQKIRAYRLEYRPDERLHKIAALQDIIGYLSDRCILTDPGPYGYLLIQDIWDYFPNEQRFFGWRFRAGLGFDYYHSSEQSTDEHISLDGHYVHKYYYIKNKKHYPYLVLNGQYSRPLSLRWHLDLGGEGRYYLKSFIEREEINITYSPESYSRYRHYHIERNKYNAISLYTTLRYFFDSRTSLHLNAHYNFGRYHEYHSLYDSHRYNRSCILDASASFEYRISIPTILRISLNGEREDRLMNDISHSYQFDTTRYYFSTRLVHYVF
jgi:hypothetical protein